MLGNDCSVIYDTVQEGLRKSTTNLGQHPRSRGEIWTQILPNMKHER